MAEAQAQESATTGDKLLPLYDKWTLYAHLPHDTDWTLDSYKTIACISSVQEGNRHM